jgi:AbrB family looped-hinge helix DNA binding protein
MTTQGPGEQVTRYEVITQEDPESGDLYIPIPMEALEKLGWKEGDTVDFTVDELGRYILKKI